MPDIDGTYRNFNYSMTAYDTLLLVLYTTPTMICCRSFNVDVQRKWL